MALGKLSEVISSICFILVRYTVYNKQIVWNSNRSLRLLVHFPKYRLHEYSAIYTFPSVRKQTRYLIGPVNSNLITSNTTDILLYIGTNILLTYHIGTKTSKTASYLILHSRAKGFFQLFTVSCAVITGRSFWSSLGFLVFLLSPGFYFWNPTATKFVSTSWRWSPAFDLGRPCFLIPTAYMY